MKTEKPWLYTDTRADWEKTSEAEKKRGVGYDAVNKPAHYRAHASGVECIQITEHMNFCLGNAIKYIWRAGLKGEAREDLQKAVFYINRELERLDANTGE